MGSSERRPPSCKPVRRPGCSEARISESRDQFVELGMVLVNGMNGIDAIRCLTRPRSCRSTVDLNIATPAVHLITQFIRRNKASEESER
jgi:hypothetical protein